MAAGLEGAKDYLVSVAERTLGRRAYRESVDGSVVNNNNPDRLPGIILGTLQLGAPAFTRALTYYVGHDINSDLYPFRPEESDSFMDFTRGFIHVWGSAVFDIGLAYTAFQVSHNPAEVIALKLAANAITHVGLDLLDAGINRAKGFRPPTSATLAV